MKRMSTILLLLLLLLVSFATLHHSLPLSTSSRWIVDESGARVKLACVNWAAHLEPMLAEGLEKQPVDEIARHIAAMGFNCVRLTWATHMFTRHADLEVSQSLLNLGLDDSVVGLAHYNPDFLSLTVVEAQRAVIQALGLAGVMVLLDNQVSEPMWCCSDNDGNGFFGDKYFDAHEWLHGLHIVANRYKHTPTVIAMSLRNELRGPHQNETDWYKYMTEGARTIHKANPNVLVLFSGLHYDTDFSFLKQKPLTINLNNKLVYEIHRYDWSNGGNSIWNQPSKACDRLTQDIQTRASFLLDRAPLFVTEFGIDQFSTNVVDNLFLGCLLGLLADMDLDWAVWAVQGTYYLRDGLHGPHETFAMLNSNWTSLTSPEFHRKLQLIQQPIQDPNSKVPSYNVLFQPWSGRCVKAEKSELLAGDCYTFSRWNYSGNGKQVQLVGTESCLSAAGDGLPVTLSSDCTSQRSRWEFISGSKFHLANKGGDGTYLCLDSDPDYSSKVLTKKCLCSSSVNGTTTCQQDSQTQWFKLLSANVH